MIRIFDTIRKIKAWLFDGPQEIETVFIPLAKLEQPKRVHMNFKTKTIEDRAKYMNVTLYEIMKDMCEWARTELGIEAVITETVTTPEEDKLLNRKSVTHQQGRAFDLRSMGWRLDQIEKFTKYFTEKYGHLGAISSTTGKPNFLVHHNVGHGNHFHCQIKVEYSVDMAKVSLP